MWRAEQDELLLSDSLIGLFKWCEVMVPYLIDIASIDDWGLRPPRGGFAKFSGLDYNTVEAAIRHVCMFPSSTILSRSLVFPEMGGWVIEISCISLLQWLTISIMRCPHTAHFSAVCWNPEYWKNSHKYTVKVTFSFYDSKLNQSFTNLKVDDSVICLCNGYIYGQQDYIQ